MPTACDEGGFNIDLRAEHERRSAVFNWLVDSEEVCFQGNRVEQWKVFLNVKGHTPGRYFNREDTPPRLLPPLFSLQTYLCNAIPHFVNKFVDTTHYLSHKSCFFFFLKFVKSVG